MGDALMPRRRGGSKTVRVPAGDLNILHKDATSNTSGFSIPLSHWSNYKQIYIADGAHCITFFHDAERGAIVFSSQKNTFSGEHVEFSVAGNSSEYGWSPHVLAVMSACAEVSDSFIGADDASMSCGVSVDDNGEADTLDIVFYRSTDVSADLLVVQVWR